MSKSPKVLPHQYDETVALIINSPQKRALSVILDEENI